MLCVLYFRSIRRETYQLLRMNYRSAKGREAHSSLAIRHQCLDGPYVRTRIICLSSAARFSGLIRKLSPASSGDREHLPR